MSPADTADLLHFGKPKYRKPERSMRAAINAFCKGCIYDKHQPGTWRQQVEACTSRRCALYEFRPVSAANQNEETTSESTRSQ